MRSKPNIIYLLADDWGYGDVSCLNPDSKIPTPHTDQLASEGMIFTDAHSNSAVCTPLRGDDGALLLAVAVEARGFEWLF